MFKRIVFTTVTPLPSHIPRDVVIETLRAHSEMIELNPLVISHKRCKAPPNAPPDEFHCIWYELTDKIHYLPGGILRGNVTYKACFHDLPRGLQTHIYAPTNLDIRNRWTVCGNMPGEPREPVELGLTNVPREGLFLREDVDMRCNVFATSFVKKTLKEAHAVLVERLIMKADLLKGKSEATIYEQSYYALSQQRHLLSTNQVYSAEGSYMSTPYVPICPSPVSPQPPLSPLSTGNVTTRYPSPVLHALPNNDSNTLRYVGGSVHYPSTPHTCCAHSPVSPLPMGCRPVDQILPPPMLAEMESTEFQPAKAKAYAAAQQAQKTRFVVTPCAPPPNIYELES
ncbi:hypothetical protein AJ78_01689 [Emergomyces pasteurianus Ep9510]|uniref:DUF7053 domain-containing protein n=1 Tax=Emergomyces pasteurianus Ep9510 TaxID=1447872 RepID=A0A1J9PQS2_9EURO|nr:hypothetical protein AJ78_01689 [Emergomyces pasteurianus Ep9510]